MIIEIIGYIGSFLVLVSFLMVSVVKLRVVNTIGSVIFMIYALIIKSYPTAIMNFCLVLINIHFLYRMSKTDDREYDLVKVKKNDGFLKYLLEKYQSDIQACFPSINLSLDNMNKGYIIMCGQIPVGITLGTSKNGVMNLILDYTIPEYRDFTIGNYLVSMLPEEGIKKLVYDGPTENHLLYLDKMGYKLEDGKFVKNL